MILRQLRLEQKLTQSDMAKTLNISRVAYTNYELGNREPDFATIKRIAAILGTTVDYLLGITRERTAKPTHSSSTDAIMNPMLRMIMLSATDLSSESCTDLAKFIEFLKARDRKDIRAHNIRSNRSDEKTHRQSQNNNGGNRNVQ